MASEGFLTLKSVPMDPLSAASRLDPSRGDLASATWSEPLCRREELQDGGFTCGENQWTSLYTARFAETDVVANLGAGASRT